MSYYLFGGQIYAFSNMQMALHSNFELLLGSTGAVLYLLDLLYASFIYGIITCVSLG